ncbi:MAG: putative toxin-antitoxin system toxin component, PIN family [Gemmatimonadota bacterium]
MRLVFDTNVLIAAFLSRGHCHELLEHAARNHDLLTSEFILREFQEKLVGKLRVEARLVDAAVELQRSRMGSVEPEPLAGPVARDPDDDWILATAAAAEADCLITGDSDLLDLGDYAGIPILSPGSFWEFEAGFES